METLNMDTLTIVFWYWWLVAVVFFILELAVPAALFIWLGFSALIVGAISFGLSLAGSSFMLEIELLIFSVLAVVMVIGWRVYQRNNPKVDNASGLNNRGAQYIGRTIVLTQPIQNGFGREKVGSSYWTIKGQDATQEAAAGQKVKIIGHEGTQLIVEVI